MLNLNDREWRPFFLTELFPQIQRGKRLKTEDHIPGKTPYVSSSALNNGVDNFISNTEKVRIFSDCISLANSGSVGSSFYEPFSFVASDHITHLKNEKYNKYHYLFIASILNRLSQKYNFNREINDNRISREKIMLPIDVAGNLDLDFMEQYIKERERQLIQKYKNFIGKNIQSGRVLTDLKSVKWKAFHLISDAMFYIDPVKTFSNTSSLSYAGIYDVVGATSKNNGNVGFLADNCSHLLCPRNCICLIKTGQGSVGKAVYKTNDFIPSNNVCVIRSKWLNQYNALFVVSEINKQADRYSYGYIRNSKRIAREKVMLPVDSYGNPNYLFMEQYGKQIMLQKYQQYLNYISVRT